MPSKTTKNVVVNDKVREVSNDDLASASRSPSPKKIVNDDDLSSSTFAEEKDGVLGQEQNKPAFQKSDDDLSDSAEKSEIPQVELNDGFTQEVDDKLLNVFLRMIVEQGEAQAMSTMITNLNFYFSANQINTRLRYLLSQHPNRPW